MLRKHIHQKHKQEKHVVCEYCGQSFFYNNKLHIHIDRHHPGVIPLQFQCELCHKGKFHEKKSQFLGKFKFFFFRIHVSSKCHELHVNLQNSKQGRNSKIHRS